MAVTNDIKIPLYVIGFILSVLFCICKYMCKSPDNENCKYSTAATFICLCVCVWVEWVGRWVWEEGVAGRDQLRLDDILWCSLLWTFTHQFLYFLISFLFCFDFLFLILAQIQFPEWLCSFLLSFHLLSQMLGFNLVFNFRVRFWWLSLLNIQSLMNDLQRPSQALNNF